MSGLVNVVGETQSGTINAQAGMPGSIIQVSADTSGTTRTNIDQGNDAWRDTVVTATFTPLYSNSDVIINSYFTVYTNNTTGDLGFVNRYKQVISGGATSYPTSLALGISSGSYGSGYWNGYTGELHWPITHVLIDSPATTSEITYTLQGSEYNAEGINVGAGQGNVGRWHMWFMEVKR